MKAKSESSKRVRKLQQEVTAQANPEGVLRVACLNCKSYGRARFGARSGHQARSINLNSIVCLLETQAKNNVVDPNLTCTAKDVKRSGT